MKKFFFAIERAVYKLSRFTSLVFVALLVILGVYATFVKFNLASDFQTSSKIKINELNLEKSETTVEQDTSTPESPKVLIDDTNLLPESLTVLLQEAGGDSDYIENEFIQLIGDYSEDEVKLIHEDIDGFIPILKDYGLSKQQIFYKLVNVYFEKLVFPKKTH